MRALGALLVVAGMTTAYAHPVRILKDPFRARYDACNTAKSWSKLTTCLARQGQKVTVLPRKCRCRVHRNEHAILLT